MLNCWMTSCSHFIQIFWRQFLQHILDLVQFLALRRPQMSPTAYWPIFVPCPWPPINCKQQPQTNQSPPHHTKIVYQSIHCPLTLRNPKDGIPYHGVKKISDIQIPSGPSDSFESLAPPEFPSSLLGMNFKISFPCCRHNPISLSVLTRHCTTSPSHSYIYKLLQFTVP